MRELPEDTALIDRVLRDDHSAITANRNLVRIFYWRNVDTADPTEAEAYRERLIAETKQRKLDEHKSPVQGRDEDSPANATSASIVRAMSRS